MGGGKKKVDLIDQFTELVVGADSPQRLAERTLEVVMSLSNGRSAALFRLDGDRITLFASRGIDQSALDLAQDVWTHHREGLAEGETVYVPERDADRQLTRQAGHTGVVSLAVVPVLVHDV